MLLLGNYIMKGYKVFIENCLHQCEASYKNYFKASLYIVETVHKQLLFHCVIN